MTRPRHLFYNMRPLNLVLQNGQADFHETCSWGTKERFWLTLAPENNMAELYIWLKR